MPVIPVLARMERLGVGMYCVEWGWLVLAEGCLCTGRACKCADRSDCVCSGGLNLNSVSLTRVAVWMARCCWLSNMCAYLVCLCISAIHHVGQGSTEICSCPTRTGLWYVLVHIYIYAFFWPHLYYLLSIVLTSTLTGAHEWTTHGGGAVCRTRRADDFSAPDFKASLPRAPPPPSNCSSTHQVRAYAVHDMHLNCIHFTFTCISSNMCNTSVL